MTKKGHSENFVFKNKNILCETARKNQNFAEILLEKSKFFDPDPRSPRFKIRLTPLHIRTISRNRNLKISKRYSKAKRTRAPAYSPALRRIKGGFPKGGQEKLRSDFQSTRRGQREQV